MSAEENKALVRYFQEGIWQGNVALVDELMAPTTFQGQSLEQFKAWVLNTRQEIPDVTFKIEEMIAEGDKVVFRWIIQGTHTRELQSPFGPMPPTGKRITVTGISIERLAGGKIVEDRVEASYFDYLHQIGAISVPTAS